jgi:signal transduction histidine kinase
LELAVDITERKKALDEIKKAHQTVSAFNTELEAKVQEKTARIEQLLKQKDEFINQLGHDLKNPLGPLINLLPLVEKNTTDEKYKKMLNVAIRNIGYMKNLVVKTIELAKLNSPNTRFNFEKIQLADLVDNIIESHKFSSEEKQINIKNAIAKDLVISADRLRMEELFNNLINNAVKYSEQNGQISIHAFIKNEHVRISITDNGIGMTKEQIAHLFDEFYKADESRHDFESSGLGMPICKRIVDKHNGKIWAESKGIGQGSTMYIKLPLHQNKNKDIEQKKDAFEREENSKKQQSDHDSVAQEIDQLIEQKT